MKKSTIISALLVYSVLLFLVVSAQNVSAAPTNITLNASDTTINIDWFENSSAQVSDYIIELSGDGGGTWFIYPDVVSSISTLDIPRSVFGYNDIDIPVKIKITTVFSDSSTEISSVADAVVTSPFTKTDRFTIGLPELVISDSQRKLLGLNQWLDGSMGFFERNNQISSVSANSGGTAKINLGENSIIGDVVDTNIQLQNNTQSSNYASGGPVYYDEPNDRLIMFYHGEFYDPSVFSFYSYIGLAASTDGGDTFEDLGQIIRPDIDMADPDRAGALDVGSATYVINGGYFYVYHKDMNEDGTDVRMAVSRAPIADVLDAAANGTTSPWQKYFNGSFSSAGVGGGADNIMPTTPSYINWMDTVYVEGLDEYVMVYTSINNGTIGSMNYITTSEDGINWSFPREIYDDFSPEEISFVTLTSPDYSRQRVVTGDTFELFRTVSASQYVSGDRWEDARVEKINISFVLDQQQVDSGPVSTSTNSQLALTGASLKNLILLGLFATLSGLVLWIIRERNLT